MSADAEPSGRFDFLLAALPLVALLAAFGAYLPLWDGAFYLRCLDDAFGPRHGAAFLFCANHPTGGYLTPLAVAFHLAGLRYAAVVAVNALLGVLGAHAVADLSALMFPGAALRAERVLVTLGFTLCPLLLACSLQLTPDLGVALFSLLTLRALARGRFALAALCGALGCFSNETGAAIYLALVASHLLVHVAWARAPLRASLRAYAPLLLAPALGVAWFVARALLQGDRVTWRGVGAQHPLWRQVLSLSFLDDVLPSQLAEIFVINFAWVLSAFVFLSAIEPLWRLLVRAPRTDDPSAEGRARAFVTVAFVVTVLAVTRFRTLVIPRYVLPAAVLLPLMAQRSLHLLKVTARLRLLLFGASAGLALFSSFRTRDALAMNLFGTFEWGDHRLLDLATRAGDLDARREHLVYNLEFTRLSALLDEAVPLALADGRHELALHRIAEWHPIGFVDDRTHRRVATARGAHEPRVWHLGEVRAAASPPARLYHLELPGMDDDDELIVWQQYYRVGPPRRFVRDGYTLSMRELTLRDAPPTALPPP